MPHTAVRRPAGLPVEAAWALPASLPPGVDTMVLKRGEFDDAGPGDPAVRGVGLQRSCL